MGDRKEKELEKLVYEHTTLFFADKDAPFIRSAAEAQRIIDSGKCASFAATLRRAMFLADMTDETKAMATRLFCPPLNSKGDFSNISSLIPTVSSDSRALLSISFSSRPKFAGP